MSDQPPIKPKKRADLLGRTLGSEGVLFDPKTNTTHALNATSLLIWNLCDGTHTAADMASALGQQFDVSPAQAQRDIGLILARFHGQGLLEPNWPPGTHEPCVA